jgi:hypothetical protein
MSATLTVRGADIFTGEIRQQGVTVTSDGSAVTPTNATYQRYHDGTALDVTPVAATISTNQVYANIAAGSYTGQHFVMFYFTVDTQTVRAKVNYNVLPVS